MDNHGQRGQQQQKFETYYQILVKGGPVGAVDEAERRGLVVLVTISRSDRESVLRVGADSSTVMALYDWFNEAPKLIEGYGFPDRTLLHFIECNKTSRQGEEGQAGGVDVGGSGPGGRHA